MRLFLAVDLPQPVLEQLAGGIEKLRKVVGGNRRFRWLPADNIHITLVFLGEVDESRLRQLSACCAAVEWSRFTLKLGGSGYFPSATRPRVFWQGCTTGIDDMRQLQVQVAGCAKAIGVLEDHRPYSPHVTLARIKTSKKPGNDIDFQRLQQKADKLLPMGVDFPVTSFSFYQSQLTSTGAIYTRLAVFQAPLHGMSTSA